MKRILLFIILLYHTQTQAQAQNLSKKKAIQGGKDILMGERVLQDNKKNRSQWQNILPDGGKHNEDKYVSKLSGSEDATFSSIIEYKNRQERFDSKFDDVDPVFVPEDSNYVYNVRSSGYIYYSVAIVVWLAIIVFLLFRLALGKCGGYKSDPPELTKLSKATPGVLILVAGFFFLGGIIVTFIGAQGYTN